MIETTDEALNYCRHLTNNEIRLMTLQRIINRDPLGQGIPPSFVSIYNTWPPERQRENYTAQRFPMKDAPAPSKSMMHFYTKSLNWKTWSPFCKPSAAPSMLR